MPSQITYGYKQMLAEADALVERLPVGDAIARAGDPDVVIVDLRDFRELEREGSIPGAFHCPRGMLEFWVDPASPYFHKAFEPACRKASRWCCSAPRVGARRWPPRRCSRWAFPT